jgi:hypothetical protein
MPTAVRKPPSITEQKSFRALESFHNDLYNKHRMVGTVTHDVGSIAPGGKQTFTIAVEDAKADQGQAVVLGLPAALSADVLPWGYVSADGVVTVVLRNPTGGAIDPAPGVYSVWVRP